MVSIIRKIIGTRNDRLLRQMSKIVTRINAFEPKIQALSDADLRGKTDEFKQRLATKETLQDLLPEAFAVVREAAKRTIGMRHFDVQLIGGMVLHDGKIAEMRTGEGKTLVATLPAYLNALTGKGVHIVTVNDYLAKRDAEWMNPVYDFLGMTVGVNYTQMPFDDKKEAYQADILYGTNNEFGFDYLRDNMSFNLEGRVQRELHFAVVDEVDCILIDEARTPLIISGPAEESSDLYHIANKLIPQLKRAEKEGASGDYTVDEKTKQAYLTEEGHTNIEKLFEKEGLIKAGDSLYSMNNIRLMHHVNAALRAFAIYKRDVDYVVKDGQVIIVDEHTGRLMEGRRWSEGLHQAVEAKENVEIQSENQTLASITFQNYFRLYDKLSGMTGTADTEAAEFHQIYGLEVVIIPTNKPIIRDDRSDLVFLTAAGKYRVIIKDIEERIQKDQPVLVGTTSIDTSEYLSKLLNKKGIKHKVLNAKQHEREAKIIAEAGCPGAVTIATNMAGRGTDIVLGGNLDAELKELENPTEKDIAEHRAQWQKRHTRVVKAGGLHVLGTERNESRRIDNQLRGRSGRQGDPGSSQYYLSLEDNLMRIFASERMQALMTRLGMEEDVPIENKMVSRSIANAQRKVERHNFDIRKQLLQFDDVANDQRKVIYDQRYALMTAENISDTIESIREDAVEQVLNEYIPPESMPEVWDIPGLEKQLKQEFHLDIPIQKWLAEDDELHEEPLRQRILEALTQFYRAREEDFGDEIMRRVEKTIMLKSLDMHWKEHLAAMDHLRQSIHLRGYAQQQPVQEYKREAFEMFKEMLEQVKRDVTATMCTIEIRRDPVPPPQPAAVSPFNAANLTFKHAEASALARDLEEEESDVAVAVEPFVRDQPKVGRNDPCPCGSGKKFKQCHGKL